jgi:hypothetical protein
MNDSEMRPACPGRYNRPELSAITVQPCIVDGCTAVSLSEGETALPLGLCDDHLAAIRADPKLYGVVCVRCRRLVQLAQIPSRTKASSNLKDQLLFLERCRECGGSETSQLRTWDDLPHGGAKDKELSSDRDRNQETEGED